MRETFVVLKREFLSYFLSPIAYVVGALFLGIGGWLFFNRIFFEVGQGAEARMDFYFLQLPFYFLVLIPALSMRLWAEERKLGTLELLMTFPVRTMHLVFGKFFGALGFVAVLLLLTLIYPVTLAGLGNLDWGPVIGGYLGAVLLAAAYLSLGLFLSSLTQDQIIALLLSVALLLLLVLMRTFGALFGPFWAEVFAILSPDEHFASIARGVIDLRDMVFYVSFCGFFLFLNRMVLEARKWVG